MQEDIAVKTFLITGGAGFIGSALIRHIINDTSYRVVNIDKLSENMASIKIQLDKSLIASIEKIAAKSKPWSNPRSWKL